VEDLLELFALGLRLAGMEDRGVLSGRRQRARQSVGVGGTVWLKYQSSIGLLSQVLLQVRPPMWINGGLQPCQRQQPTGTCRSL